MNELNKQKATTRSEDADLSSASLSQPEDDVAIDTSVAVSQEYLRLIELTSHAISRSFDPEEALTLTSDLDAVSDYVFRKELVTPALLEYELQRDWTPAEASLSDILEVTQLLNAALQGVTEETEEFLDAEVSLGSLQFSVAYAIGLADERKDQREGSE